MRTPLILDCDPCVDDAMAIALLLLGRSLIGTKGGKENPFSLGGYYLGAGVPLALALGRLD